MENKLFTIVNKEDEASFLADLKANPNNFKKKVIFLFSDSNFRLTLFRCRWNDEKE